MVLTLIMIEVRLFASFRKGRWKSRKLDYADSTTVSHILSDLKINESEVGILMVNGAHATVEKILLDQDIVSLFPPLAGG